MAAGLERLGGRILARAAARKLRSNAEEKSLQLACLGFGDSKLQIVIDLPRQAIDAFNDRQGLGGEHQDMNAAIIAVRPAFDEAGRLQPVEQANE
jgi:hypothetical protein